jgi:uncharacterized protein YjdB
MKKALFGILACLALSGFVLTGCEDLFETPVTGVYLDKNSLGIVVGQKVLLTATVSPSDAKDTGVTWTSEDDDIATVSSNGLVTGVGVGGTVVTVKTNDGNRTATCMVTVSEAE